MLRVPLDSLRASWPCCYPVADFDSAAPGEVTACQQPPLSPARHRPEGSRRTTPIKSNLRPTVAQVRIYGLSPAAERRWRRGPSTLFLCVLLRGPRLANWRAARRAAPAHHLAFCPIPPRSQPFGTLGVFVGRAAGMPRRCRARAHAHQLLQPPACRACAHRTKAHRNTAKKVGLIALGWPTVPPPGTPGSGRAC